MPILDTSSRRVTLLQMPPFERGNAGMPAQLLNDRRNAIVAGSARFAHIKRIEAQAAICREPGVADFHGAARETTADLSFARACFIDADGKQRLFLNRHKILEPF